MGTEPSAMTDVKQANQLTNKQLEKLLNIEHIRQHLIRVGLGEIISKEEYERSHKRRSRQRHTSCKNIDNQQKYQTIIHRPSTAVSTRHPMENIKNRQSKSPDYHSINRRCKSASTSQSKQKNKSQSPTYLSSPNQSTHAKSISMRHTVSPKIIPISDRCLITMIYYGPQITVNYERNWFEPEGDEIVVMQQHCGGKNLIVYKGVLKANEIFQFESRRHSDYPFALAFYVNGLIDNRLSICCESRYKYNVRIGGKRGLFGIMNVQKSKACRRCRFEQRVKRLAGLKTKTTPIINEISTLEPNLTHSTSPKERHESPFLNQELNRTDSPNAYSSDFDIPEEKIHPVVSTPDENGISTSEKNPNHQHRLSIVSTEKDSDNETTRITKRSNRSFEKAFAEINRNENIDEYNYYLK